MVDVRAISRKVATAKSQARIYWLIIAAFLIVQLFPVVAYSNELHYEKARPGKIAFVLPDLNHNPLDCGALKPRRKQPRLENTPFVRVPLEAVKKADLAFPLPYEATGPPPATRII